MKAKGIKLTIAAVLTAVCALTILSGCGMGNLGSANYLHESEKAKDARMRWWRQDRFGMFIHWGVYSVPAGQWKGKDIANIGEWIMTNAHIPVAEYEKFTGQFNPVKFDADEWVRIAKGAGMKYIVITSKHHDGFCLWDSKVGDYDIIDRTPYKKDILKALAKACKKHGVKFCFYHSIMDWHHPDYLPRRKWEKRSAEGADMQRYIAYMKAQLKELVTEYDPAVLWFDGEWESTWNHEEGLELYNYVRSLKPDIIINNRVDKGRAGMQGLTKEGDFAGDFGTPEQEIPARGLPGVDWESCMTMNDTWGFKTNDHNWKSTETLIHQLVNITSKGGNYLLNIGPKADGTFPRESIDRLREIGEWMDINGEAIYGTTAWSKAEYKTEYTAATRKDSTIDFDWGNQGPFDQVTADDFSVVWIGHVQAKYSQEYSFHTISDDGVRLWIGDELLIDNWTDHGATEDTGTITLQAGRKYPLKMEYYEKTGGATAKLLWSSKDQPRQIIPKEALLGGVTGVYKFTKGRELFFTAKGDTVYAISTQWPGQELSIDTTRPSGNVWVTLLGYKGGLSWRYEDNKMVIDVSMIDKTAVTSDHAWVFKIEGL